MSELGRDFFEENIQVLAQRDPQLAQRLQGLSVPANYELVDTPQGPSVLIDNRAQHSRRQPEEEARRLLQGAELSDESDPIFLGMGLGYALRAWHSQCHAASQAVIIEPDPVLFRLALSTHDWRDMLSNVRIHWWVGASLEQCQQAFLQLGPHLLSAPLKLIPHQPSMARHTAFFENFQAQFSAWVETATMMLRSQVGLGKQAVANRMQNATAYAQGKRLSDANGILADRDGILVAAGPSLAKNIDALITAQRKAHIICVGTALKPLLAKGIVPDMIAVLDFSPISAKYLEDVQWPDERRPTLVVDSRSTGHVAAHYDGDLLWVDDRLLESWCQQRVVEQVPNLSTEGALTVAHLAYQALVALGVKRIMLCGLDLSFSHGVSHISGIATYDEYRPLLNRFCSYEMLEWEHLMRFGPQLHSGQDVNGQPVYIDSQMLSYHQLFTQYFAQSPVPVIDATEGGLVKAHTIAKTLVDAIGEQDSTENTYADWQVRLQPRAAADDLADMNGPLVVLHSAYEAGLKLLRTIESRDVDQSHKAHAYEALKTLQAKMHAFPWVHFWLNGLQVGNLIQAQRAERDVARYKHRGEDNKMLAASYRRDAITMEGMLDSLNTLQTMLEGNKTQP